MQTNNMVLNGPFNEATIPEFGSVRQSRIGAMHAKMDDYKMKLHKRYMLHARL